MFKACDFVATLRKTETGEYEVQCEICRDWVDPANAETLFRWWNPWARDLRVTVTMRAS